MDKDKIKELQNKIFEALKMASIKMIEAKKKSNGQLAICHNGEIMIVNARELN